MVNQIRKTVKEENEMSSKAIETISKTQTEILELRNMLIELPNLIENFNRFNQAKEKKNQWTWRQSVLNYPVRGTKRKRKTKKSLCQLWDTIKRNNQLITGVPEREEREKGTDAFFKEIISKKFLNLGGNLDIQVPEFIGLQRVSTLKVLLLDTL